jgi:hypothetical protein
MGELDGKNRANKPGMCRVHYEIVRKLEKKENNCVG